MVGYPLQIDDLPPPPSGKVGWPWTESSPILPPQMSDGTPWPRISIVTPSFNQGLFIEETIRSVLLQGYPNLEYIIIDGGSADNSIEIIEKYSSWLDYWISEKDSGQSNAINKGLVRCTGTWFNWVNSDDVLAARALSLVACASNNVDLVAGAVRHFGEDQPSEVIANKNLSTRTMLRGSRWTTGCQYQQPALWLRLALLHRCGGIDEQFQYAFDWDLTIRFLAITNRVRYLPEVLVDFRLHPNSKTVSQHAMFYKERLRILQKLSENSKPVLAENSRIALRQDAWWRRLEEIRNYSGWQRSAQIFLEIWADPQVRFSRLSLGALRRSLFDW